MFNYLLQIEYDGTNFVGWQSQKNGKSIQDSIEKALKRVLKKKIRIIGAGRTDKGVHAFSQYANFKFEKKIQNKKIFLDSINFFLKKNFVSILDLKKKNFNFNARFDAKLRTYEYFIINRLGTLSIYKNKAWHIKKKIDLQLMKKGAKVFEGTHNFGTCRASSCSARSAIKRVYPIKISKLKDKIKVRISSKSFLQNQVRSMIGCLKYLSTGKWSYLEFKKAFKSKNRTNCAPPAPAHGLYLFDIKY